MSSRVKVVVATFLSLIKKGERENKTKRQIFFEWKKMYQESIGSTNLGSRNFNFFIQQIEKERDEDEFSSSKGDDTTDQSDLQILAKQV